MLHGELPGDVTNGVLVQISGGTAPTGSATAALQTTGNTKLDTLHTDLGLLATAAAQTSSNTKLDTLHTDLAALTDGTQRVKTALPTGAHIGTPLTVGTSSAQFGSQATTIGYAIFSAPVANTATIYLGRATGVTTSTGIELAPGDSILLPCANINEIWAISGTASQNCRALAQ